MIAPVILASTRFNVTTIRVLVATAIATTLIGPAPLLAAEGPRPDPAEVPAHERVRLQSDRISLALLESDFVAVPGEVLNLRYELTGPLPDRPEPPPPGPDDTDTGDMDTGDTNTDNTDTSDTDTNGSEPTEPEWVTLRISVHEAVTQRSQVREMLTRPLPPVIDSITVPLDELDPEIDGPITILDLEVPIRPTERTQHRNGENDENDENDDQTNTEQTATEIAIPGPGLYPISVELIAEGRRLTRHLTFVERLAGDGERQPRRQPYHLTVVAGLVDPGPEPSPLELVEARSRVREIAELGDALDNPMTVSLPPVIARAIASDGELATELDRALLGSDVLALPETWLDPSTAVRAEESESFIRELREGEDVLTAILPSTAVNRATWLYTEPISTEGAQLLRDLGFRLLIAPLEYYYRLDGSLHPAYLDPSLLSVIDWEADASMALAVVDPVSDWLDPDRADGRTPTEAAVLLLAELSATRIQLPDATRLAVLSTPSFRPPDADVLANLEPMVERHPAFSFRTANFVANATDVIRVDGQIAPVTLPQAAGADLRARAASIHALRDEITTIASMLPDQDPRPSSWAEDLDLWISPAFDDAEVTRRLDAMRTEVTSIPSLIVPPEPFTFTLTGSTSELTVRIGNDGPTPLRVLLRAQATKLDFPDGDLLLTVEPGINIIDLPVRTLSNGTFPVTVELLTPDGNLPIADPVTLTARVSALTGLGQVLTGGAILVLVTWWLSHLRTRRRRVRDERLSDCHSRHPSATLN